MDFNDYCKSTKFDSASKTANAKFQNDVKTQNSTGQIDEQNIRQTLNKYQGMSQSDLMQELIKETNKQKQNGKLNDQKLAELGSQLKPMLDDNQKTKLDEILKMLRWNVFFHKIDDKLLSLVKTQSSNQQVNCFVYAKNFYYAKRYLKNQFDKNLKEYPFINAFGLNISIDKILSLAKKSDITYISSVAKVFAQMDQTRKIMNIDEVQKNLDGEGVTIAIIDTGICEHLDFCSFDNRIVLFKDFINGKEYPYDDNGHGTFVAGVIGGNGFLSGKKYQGVAPKSKIIMCKALDKNGETGATTILEAMQWIYDNHKQYNIRVVCMSFGSQPLISGDPLMLGAEALWNAGIVVVAAAGNSGPSAKTIKSPGISPKIITVGALDDGRKTGEIDEKNFKLAEFSSRGPAFNYYKPDCVACGVDIVSNSNSPQDFYTKMSGTSVATPIIAGSCALLLSKHPNLSPLEVKSRVLRSCQKIVNDRNEEGFGLLDLNLLCK